MGKTAPTRSDEVNHGQIVPVFSRVNLRQQAEKWSEGRPVTTKKVF
jgi:hypothetical protein